MSGPERIRYPGTRNTDAGWWVQGLKPQGDPDENKLDLQRWTDKRSEGNGYRGPSQASDACFQKHPDICQDSQTVTVAFGRPRGSAVGTGAGSRWLVRAESRRASGEGRG